jgi:hypothetical protein
VPKSAAARRATSRTPKSAQSSPVASSNGNGEPKADTASLRFLVEESQRIIRYQFEAGNELSDKAEAVVKFNGVLFGLILTGIGLALKSDLHLPEWLPTWVAVILGIAGPGILLASMLFAASAFKAVDFEIGLYEDKMKEALQFNIREEQLLAKAVESYADGITTNRLSVNTVEARISWSLVLLALGTAFSLTAALFTWLGN